MGLPNLSDEDYNSLLDTFVESSITIPTAIPIIIFIIHRFFYEFILVK